MVNFLTTGIFLLASGFAAGASIPSAQVPSINGTAENEVNLLKRDGRDSLEVQMFMISYYKDQINTIVLQPNRCNNIPNIDSAILDGGKQGAGSIMFCTQINCLGKCYNSLRADWLYPGNMQHDLGGRANSVIWFNPTLDSLNVRAI